MKDPANYRPTQRFGDRVADYALARPGYPPALVGWLLSEARLGSRAVAADIGSGTGLFTRDLLAAGLQVFAVEPNAPMRTEAERTLSAFPKFTSVDGSAEATGLPDAGIDLITAAQAFHWFGLDAARGEARRILRPGGVAALIWNVRRPDSPFAKDYEALLLEHCADYAQGQPRQASPDDIAAFFGPGRREQRFDQQQSFDRAGLQARLLSSSYTPKTGDPARRLLLAALREIFDRRQQDGRVQFDYDTHVYLGRPRAS